MLKDSLGSIILWKNVPVMILTYHEVLMMYGPRRRGSVLGTSDGVLFIKELPFTEE